MPVAPVAFELAEPDRELIDVRLDFLQTNHVGGLSLDEVLQLGLPRPNAVDVPGGDLHHGRAVTKKTAAVVLVVVLGARWASTQPQDASRITTPKQQFGASIGDDYFLANYTQIEAYWKKLDAESDRLSLVDIGRSEEGRTQWMAIVTAPENIRALDRYRTISQRLAHASGLADEEARALAADGKSVV